VQVSTVVDVENDAVEAAGVRGEPGGDFVWENQHRMFANSDTKISGLP
jgi:hypothetical protein